MTIGNRAALESILFVTRTGIGWNRLPTGLFGASGATCWRRLAEWRGSGSAAAVARESACRVACGREAGAVVGAGRGRVGMVGTVGHGRPATSVVRV
ncbi:hypothetical protein C5E45_10015 [Nocardia nova]|uniref:Insertion element IS402-like domain-containing protein n=1 Tax=Nocardia nova TaxID=37330 RepID=A0A2S6ATF8_9NOCA|nr:hypothetical protein C5E45_10015 [Nocardia nova]